MNLVKTSDFTHKNIHYVVTHIWHGEAGRTSVEFKQVNHPFKEYSLTYNTFIEKFGQYFNL